MIKLILFGLIVAGLVLFVIWAKDNLKKTQLLQVAIGLIIIGCVGSLVCNSICKPSQNLQPKESNYQAIYTPEDPTILELKKLMNIE
jgi:uncharacterized membrane protein YqjE